ncbi:MAG TPA: DUF1579 domain-containing protein [Ktedonobacteraceae bacterium]|nr:DUF1579 domain-containing protein [Ktedonobacteraceae bacterium]
MSEATDFDFLLGSWNIHNAYINREGAWQEFEARHTGEEKHLDGRVLVEHFEGTLSNGDTTKGMTIRAFDPQTHYWSIVWLDNRNRPDFRPMLGKFQDGVGLFYQDTEAPDGRPMRMRYTWDNITEHTARWQQAISFDGGNSWDTNWIMDFTR